MEGGAVPRPPLPYGACPGGGRACTVPARTRTPAEETTGHEPQ
ncbi:hypothetical protein SCATT_p09310 (plasmid) [Streptantibioticus cattleyicolor NRRL 8057 = DSM 46488]|uniref:Uncharacterized protein n=1 Tax=Streptantibioticus cattleyicolor (strain ATCC 35852 / DSM 46488 / JCM 4925 / NBRC 14057 / NRRL 8057) TaxID=1003195 RepID=G8XDH9_STREN|nr:hypothetical protein SCATT_p09310 [Streptantibioticus cattleyicolor NRRL 8057 = DSM 46488]